MAAKCLREKKGPKIAIKKPTDAYWGMNQLGELSSNQGPTRIGNKSISDVITEYIGRRSYDVSHAHSFLKLKDQRIYM
jgi:hypothetical protein